MSRVKRGTIKMKRRRNVLSQTKGYRFGRSTKEAAAKEAIKHAGKYAFRDRRKKKTTNRQLWNVKLGSSAKAFGLSYSKMIGALKKKGIALDRKVLALIAEHHPETFERLAKSLS
jgi:large subunit ribosomal protein L20